MPRESGAAGGGRGRGGRVRCGEGTLQALAFLVFGTTRASIRDAGARERESDDARDAPRSVARAWRFRVRTRRTDGDCVHGVDGRERRAMRARRGMAPRRHRHSQHSEKKAKKAIRRRLLIGCHARDIFLDSQTLDPHARIADRRKSFNRDPIRGPRRTRTEFLLRQAARVGRVSAPVLRYVALPNVVCRRVR